jgi:hypothetical protein
VCGDRCGMVISPNKLYVDKRTCIVRDVLGWWC